MRNRPGHSNTPDAVSMDISDLRAIALQHPVFQAHSLRWVRPLSRLTLMMDETKSELGDDWMKERQGCCVTSLSDRARAFQSVAFVTATSRFLDTALLI
jgi:hypothetical protein